MKDLKSKNKKLTVWSSLVITSFAAGMSLVIMNWILSISIVISILAMVIIFLSFQFFLFLAITDKVIKISRKESKNNYETKSI